MYLQNVLRFVLFWFLAVEVWTVKAEEFVSLDSDDKDMETISTERRRGRGRAFSRLFRILMRAIRRKKRKKSKRKKRNKRRPLFTCNHNCWHNNWKHRDRRARGARKYNNRCSYGHFGGKCYCYGKPEC